MITFNMRLFPFYLLLLDRQMDQPIDGKLFLGLLIPILETGKTKALKWNDTDDHIHRFNQIENLWSIQKLEWEYDPLWPSAREVVLPVIKLEMIRGRMSIFSILMSISPGKAISITTSGWIGDAKRRSPPHTAPRMTPIRKGEKYEFSFCPHQMNSSRDVVQWHWPSSYFSIIRWWLTHNKNTIRKVNFDDSWENTLYLQLF